MSKSVRSQASQSGRSQSSPSRVNQASTWRYDAGDGEPLVLRTAPSISAPRTMEQLRPGTIFAVDEQHLGDDGVLYLRLTDGRGWAFDMKPGVGVMCHRFSLREGTYWRYDAGDSTPLVVRETPEMGGRKTDTVLQPGEVFCVSQEQAGEDGVLFLQLADGRGWAFDRKPGVGTMCERHKEQQSAEAPPSNLWRYIAPDRRPIWIRNGPEINGARTEEVLEFGAIFSVKKVLQGKDGVNFLELEDGTGWVFDQKPGVGVMCEVHEAPVWLHIYDVPSHPTGRRMNGALRRIGTGAFHAGVEVYGQEWSFGSAEDEDEGTGVFSCAPKGCEGHAYRESLPMGHTPLSEEEVRELLGRLSKEWQANDYDMLRRNCCHFSDMLCEELQVGGIPRWVRNLSGFARRLDDSRQSFHQAVASATMRGKSRRGAGESDAYRFGDFSTGVLETVGEKALELFDNNPVLRNVRQRVLRKLAFEDASPSTPGTPATPFTSSPVSDDDAH